MNLSILQNFKPENLHLDPFPYINIENALPIELYNQLAQEYPESVLNGATSGFKDFRYEQHNFTEEHITPLWKKFIDYHTSKEYKDELIRAILPGLKKYYPDIVEKYLDSGVVLRRTGKPVNAIALEVQFVMNSADTEKIRTPHLDQGRELFACLFYMKKPEDLSTGGDLVVYKKTNNNFKFNSGRLAPEEQIEEVSRIKYQANNLIIFLNTVDSIHGVSQRIDAEVFRRYINIDGHVAEKLFRLD